MSRSLRAFGSLAVAILLLLADVTAAYKKGGYPAHKKGGYPAGVPEPRIKYAPYYEEAKFAFEFALLSYVTQNTRGSDGDNSRFQLTDFATPLIKNNLTLMNDVYGTNYKLVWGPAYHMEVDYESVGPKSLLPNELSKQCGYPTGNDDFFSGFLGFANAAWAACSTAPFFGQVNEDQQTYMNMMFVAYDDVADSYFIGIAGTNGISTCTWLAEDFASCMTVPWQYGWPGELNIDPTKINSAPGVTAGLNYGFRAMTQYMRPVGSAEGGSTTLQEFFGNRTITDKTKISLTGHSLGGMLAPVVGLWFQDTTPAEIHVVSFAAATSGNEAWAAYYDSRPLAKNTFYYDNQFDVIPKAWAPATLNELLTMYIPELFKPEDTPCLQKIVDFFNKLAVNTTSPARAAAFNEIEFAVGFSTAYPGLEAPSEEIILNGTSIPGKGFFPRDLNVTVNGTTRDTIGTIVGIIIGAECTPTFNTLFAEGVGWQHIAPYALMFVPLVAGPSFPTPPPLPQQGCRTCNGLFYPNDVPCICIDPMLPVPKTPPPPGPQLPPLPPPAALPPGVTPVPKAIMAMMAKVVFVAEACPFEQMQIAPALVKARIAICMALEPNFWEPVSLPTKFEFDRCLACIAERGQDAVSCDYFYTCVQDLRVAEALVPDFPKALKEFCCPTPIPPFVPPPTPEELLCKKKGGKYCKHLKPTTRPVLPAPIPYY